MKDTNLQSKVSNIFKTIVPNTTQKAKMVHLSGARTTKCVALANIRGPCIYPSSPCTHFYLPDLWSLHMALAQALAQKNEPFWPSKRQLHGMTAKLHFMWQCRNFRIILQKEFNSILLRLAERSSTQHGARKQRLKLTETCFCQIVKLIYIIGVFGFNSLYILKLFHSFCKTIY